MTSSKFAKIKIFTLVIIVVGFFIGLIVFLLLFIQGKRITSDGEIIDTGVVKLSIIPDDAEIYVDDKKVGKGDDSINNIDIGDREIRIEKDEYTSWSKDIEVKKNRVDVLEVQLYPEELPEIESVKDVNIDEFSFSAKNSDIFFSVIEDEDDDNLGIWKLSTGSQIINLSESEPEKFVEFDNSILERLRENEYFFEVSDNSQKLLLNIPDLEEIYIFNSNDDYSNLTQQLGFYPSKVNWFDGSASLLIESENILYEFNPITEESNVVFFNPVEDFIYTYSDNTVYLWDKSSNRLKLYRNGGTESIDLKEVYEEELVINNIKTPINNENVLVLETSDSLLYIDFESNVYEKVISEDKPAKIVDIAPNGKKVLFTQDNILWSAKVKDRVSSDDNDNITLSEVSEIEENTIYSFTQSNRSLFTMNDATLTMSDADGENSYEFPYENISSLSNIYISNNNRDLYFVAPRDDSTDNVEFRLYKQELVLE